MTTVRRPLVVVPTYNEADNIAALLDRVRAAVPNADVLVIDDSSPDGTGELVRRRACDDDALHLITGANKGGLGAAYRTGFGWAVDRPYDAVVQMDADLSHPPERLPTMLMTLADADVVLGSRYVHGGDVAGWALSRRLISWAGNHYARRILGLPVKDVTAGFKAWRPAALIASGALASTSDGYCFQIENTWRASRRGLRVVEIPITFTDRTSGASKMSGAIAIEAMLRVLCWRWSELRGTPTRPAAIST